MAVNVEFGRGLHLVRRDAPYARSPLLALWKWLVASARERALLPSVLMNDAPSLAPLLEGQTGAVDQNSEPAEERHFQLQCAQPVL